MGVEKVMGTLIIISCIDLLISWFIQGFNLWTITAIISTAMFSGKAVGFKCRLKHIITVEALGAFLTVIMQLLFDRFAIGRLLLLLLIRGIFIGVAVYDEKCFIYITEEHRKD